MTVADMMGTMDIAEFNVLLKHANPSDTFLNKRASDITSWRYCDVMDFVDDGTLMGMATKATGLTEQEILKGDGHDFVKFLKHLKNEAEKIVELEKRLGSEPTDELVNAGIDRLNAFGVVLVYYSISNDPRDWDAISELPYNKIWTRMMLDKVNGDIQRNIEKMQAQKQKK